MRVIRYLTNKIPNSLLRNFKTETELWIICIPIIIWVIIFHYIPMYGVLMAFVNYVPGKSLWESQFVGLTHFIRFFQNPAFFQLLRNTLAMSLLSLTIGFVSPIIFSLMLNEFRCQWLKKTIQTISYFPHFISWVAAGSMIYTVLASDGATNAILLQLGLIEQPLRFLTEGSYYWGMFTGINIWKGLGWASIIYLAAMTGVRNRFQ